MSNEDKATSDGIEFGLKTLGAIPLGDARAIECHITGVLAVFLGALQGTLGDDYARDFLTAHLNSMNSNAPTMRFTKPTVQ